MITRVQSTLGGLILDVRPGPVTAILGPNGAGKSTILNAIQWVATGQLAWPAGKSGAPKTPKDLAAALLPEGSRGAFAEVIVGGVSMSRSLSRNEAGEVSISADCSSTPKVGAKRPTSTQHAAHILGTLRIDPLAYSLQSWLERTGPQRVSELGDLAQMRLPTAEEIDAAFGSALTLPGADAVRVACGGKVSDVIDAARARATEAQQRKANAERDVTAANADIARRQQPGRGEPEVRAALARDRERQVVVAGLLEAYAERAKDLAGAQERAMRCDARLRDAERALTDARATADRARRDMAALDARQTPGAPDVAALEWERDCARDSCNEANDALDEAERKFGAADQALQNAREDEVRYVGGDEILDELVAFLRTGGDGENRAADLVMGWRAGRGAAAAQARVTHRAAKAAEAEAEVALTAAKKVARAATEALEKAERTIDAAKTTIDRQAAERERDASRRETWTQQIAAVEPAERAAADARKNATDARAEVERHTLGEDHASLVAEAAALKMAVKAAGGDLETLREIAAAEARRDEAGARVLREEETRATWGAAEGRLQTLRKALIAEALAPLNDAADAIYHAATGGHVRFDSGRGGVDLIDAVGRARPIEAASVGERALAFPAISVALQRARGVEKPLILLDGLESVDARLGLLRECVRLQSAGLLHQVLANWTSTDIATEAAAVRVIDGVTVVVLGDAKAQREAA